MLIRNTEITLRWEITQNPLASNFNEEAFDLQIVAPNGAATYLEGSTSWSDSFTPPTTTTDGLITYAYTFTQKGIYSLHLGTGTSSNFTILSTSTLLVSEAKTTSTEIVTLF